jgi:hypothetical protein
LINNRQAGRRRGRGGQQQRPQGNPGRQDNGNRIDNRARGNAAQLLEKYKTLARDAQMQGDRVNTEYYLQFADHYFRVLAETRSRFEENRRQNGGAPYEEDEQEYDEDGEPIARPEPRAAEPRQSNGNGGQDRGGQDRDRGQNGNQDRQDRQDRGNRQNEGANGNQQSGQQYGQQSGQQSGQPYGQQAGQYDDERPRSRNNGNSYEGNNDRYARDDRGDRGGNDRSGNDRGAGDRGNRASYAQDDEDRAPVRREAPVRQEAPARQEAAPAAAPASEDRPRRGRPPRRVIEEEAPAVFEADLLPPSLNISAVSTDEPEEKPRRRRGRPPASETTSAS